MTSSARPWPSGRTYRIALAGWRWIGAANGACATNMRRPTNCPASQFATRRSSISSCATTRMTMPGAGSSRTGHSACLSNSITHPGWRSCQPMVRRARSRRPRAQRSRPAAVFLDEQGSVLLSGYVGGFEAEETIAVLHDHDLEPFSSLANWHAEACGAALGTLTWGDRTFDIEPIARAEVAKRYGFVARPAE